MTKTKKWKPNNQTHLLSLNNLGTLNNKQEAYFSCRCKRQEREPQTCSLTHQFLHKFSTVLSHSNCNRFLCRVYSWLCLNFNPEKYLSQNSHLQANIDTWLNNTFYIKVILFQNRTSCLQIRRKKNLIWQQSKRSHHITEVSPIQLFCY